LSELVARYEHRCRIFFYELIDRERANTRARKEEVLRLRGREKPTRERNASKKREDSRRIQEREEEERRVRSERSLYLSPN